MSKNILLVKLGAIGDVLRTTCVLHGLREKYGKCRITWLTKKSSKEVLLNNPLIDEIVLFDADAENSLKGKTFDVVITLDEDYDACEFVNKFKGERIGFYLENGKVLVKK